MPHDNLTMDTQQRQKNLGAVVLCGGKSSRMTTDKSQLVFLGKTFLEHVIDQVSKVAVSVVVVSHSAGLPSLPANKNVIFANDHQDGLGPLEGIRVGLKTLAQQQIEFAFVTGCDAPLIKPELIRVLFEKIDDYQAVVPISGNRVFGMTAIYRTELFRVAQSLLQQDRQAVKYLARNVVAKRIKINELRTVDPELDSFTNVNTQEDYENLLKRL